jgi:DNA-binding SARP family transcriptional activator/DNA polymerase III delta prime subunit
MLRVRLAGGLALELDGRPLPPPRSRRARALLAWLALRPGVHARAEVAARFWPDVLDESARASLRAALTELRGALGPGAAHLLTTRETVGLDGGDELWVDVRAFARLLEEGRVAEAVDACQGDLLAGLDDDWVHDARASHGERMAAALEQLAGTAERAGDHDEAIRRTRAAVAYDPLAEEPNRRLIARLAAAGDRASAIAAYDHLAGRLRTALGIAPSAATRQLVATVKAPDAPSPAGPPAAVARAAGAPFVGRAAESRRLRATWAGVRLHEARRLLLLAGEPGAGKTRLALELAREVLDEGAVVLHGRCSEEPLLPYEPFAECLRQAGELDGVLGERGESADDPGARHRLFGAVDAALTDAAAGRPLLLVLDDLHWADRPTLLLLVFLLRSTRRGPLLVAGTYRTTELGRRSPLTGALAELQRDGALERVVVRALEPADVAALADVWLGTGAGERVAGDVHARTAGNAFFVEEILRALAEHAGDPVPESVRHAVAVRLARLRPESEELLGVAAVLGQVMETWLLGKVSGLAGESVEAALDELLAAHLLRPGTGPPRTVEFPHALVREAVLEELNALKRTRLHRRAADALIEASQERHVEAIAHHLSEAADRARAADYLTRAGARAMAMLAYEEAALHYERAIEAQDGEDGELWLARGEALMRAGEPAAARECFLSAASIARRRRDPRLLARAALGHGGLGVSIIEVDHGKVALLEEALAALGDDDALLSSQLLSRLALELYYAPSRDRSEALSAQAVSVARHAGDRRALAAALGARHVALWRPDRLDERRATAEEMIAAARAAGDRALELQGRNWLVTDLWELGEIAAWRGEVARHGALAQDLRLPGFTWYAPLWAAVDALHAGRFEEAARLRVAAREAGERAGEPNTRLFDKMLEFHESAMRSDFAAADLEFVRDKIANSPAGMSYRASHAWILAGRGEHDSAREQLAVVGRDEFRALAFDANWPSAMGESAAAVALLGDRHLAAPLYDLIVPYARRPLTAGRAIVSYGAADRHLGLLATVLGRADAAVAHLEAAVALDAERGMRPWTVHGRLALAAALEAAGHRDRAGAEWRRAQEEAEALGIAAPLQPVPPA